MAYATQLAEVRFGEDPDKELILERVRDAAKEEVTRRLMRTPLQVTIMALLLERRARPPRDRYGLATVRRPNAGPHPLR